MYLVPVLMSLIPILIGISLSAIAFHYILKINMSKFLNLSAFETNKENRTHFLPLRIQAHERLIIFIDRINPANLLVRLHQQGIDIATLHAVILNEIRTEYQHNITQQLYVSSENWAVIKKLKEDTIAMINNAVQGLPNHSSGIELSKVILQHMAEIEQNPYDLSIELIKRDIQRLF